MVPVAGLTAMAAGELPTLRVAVTACGNAVPASATTKSRQSEALPNRERFACLEVMGTPERENRRFFAGSGLEDTRIGFMSSCSRAKSANFRRPHCTGLQSSEQNHDLVFALSSCAEAY